MAVSRLAVNAMPNDPWGQPLTLVAFAGMFCSALRTPAHGLARQLQTHAQPISLVRGGLGYFGLAASPAGPTGHLAPTFLAHLRRVANQNKQPAGPVPTKKIR